MTTAMSQQVKQLKKDLTVEMSQQVEQLKTDLSAEMSQQVGQLKKDQSAEMTVNVSTEMEKIVSAIETLTGNLEVLRSSTNTSVKAW